MGKMSKAYMKSAYVKRYTPEHYLLLGNMHESAFSAAFHLAKEFRIKRAVLWLWKRGPSVRSMEKFLSLSLEEMPLYLNDPSQRTALIAKWRLEIGR